MQLSPGACPSTIETTLLSHRSRSANQCRQACEGEQCLDSCVERRPCAVLFDPGRRRGVSIPARLIRQRAGKGLGLIAMQERVSAIGGTLHIESRPGVGTELCIRLTLEGDHANSHRAGRMTMCWYVQGLKSLAGAGEISSLSPRPRTDKKQCA